MSVALRLIVGGAVLAHARLFISGRYHPSILASLGGTPCIFLATHAHKMGSLSRLLKYDPQRVKISAHEVADALRRGTPSIEINPETGQTRQNGLGTDANTIVIGVWMLQPGEDMIVAKRLYEVLSQAAV